MLRFTQNDIGNEALLLRFKILGYPPCFSIVINEPGK